MNNADMPDSRPPHHGAETASEEEVLRREAQWAKDAMAEAAAAIKSSLAQAVDPKAWAKLHPWLSVGAAATAGFAAARAVRDRSDAETVLKYLRKLQHEGESQRQAAPAAAAEATSGGGSWMSTLMSVVRTAAYELPAIYSQMKAAEAAQHAAAAADSAQQSSAESAAESQSPLGNGLHCTS